MECRAETKYLILDVKKAFGGKLNGVLWNSTLEKTNYKYITQ
jgi:hypothetical protein